MNKTALIKGNKLLQKRMFILNKWIIKLFLNMNEPLSMQFTFHKGQTMSANISREQTSKRSRHRRPRHHYTHPDQVLNVIRYEQPPRSPQIQIQLSQHPQQKIATINIEATVDSKEFKYQPTLKKNLNKFPADFFHNPTSKSKSSRLKSTPGKILFTQFQNQFHQFTTEKQENIEEKPSILVQKGEDLFNCTFAAKMYSEETIAHTETNEEANKNAYSQELYSHNNKNQVYGGSTDQVQKNYFRFQTPIERKNEVLNRSKEKKQRQDQRIYNIPQGKNMQRISYNGEVRRNQTGQKKSRKFFTIDQQERIKQIQKVFARKMLGAVTPEKSTRARINLPHINTARRIN